MAKLNAASRLREDVLKVPNTVLLIAAGKVDRVIRFSHRPEMLKKYRFDKARETSQINEDIETPYTILSMDKGPEIEAWNNIMREVTQTARRDRPVPQPLQVADDCHEEWSLGNEDVPVIELNVIEVVAPVTVTPVVQKVEAKQVEPEKSKEAPRPTRAPGHIHRGRCGKKCFESKELAEAK